jgi:plasmid stability protein
VREQLLAFPRNGEPRVSCYTAVVGLRNVTITLDEDVARWARIRAAERDTSVSRLVGELLRERMLEEQSYEVAMREYLARPPRKLRKPGTRYPRRADLYGR